MRNKPRITPTANFDLPLLRHVLAAPSAFTPESLIEAVRVERNIRPDPVPEVCILEFDGDLTDWLVANGRTERYPAWACFHTTMVVVDVDGGKVGLIARTIGGPYTVLVAEQLAASGAKVILGLTSAGRVSKTLPIPSLVIASSALRDEGTSYHYLPAAEAVEGDADLAQALRESLSSLSIYRLSPAGFGQQMLRIAKRPNSWTVTHGMVSKRSRCRPPLCSPLAPREMSAAVWWLTSPMGSTMPPTISSTKGHTT